MKLTAADAEKSASGRAGRTSPPIDAAGMVCDDTGTVDRDLIAGRYLLRMLFRVFDAYWFVLSARHCAAPIHRDRSHSADPTTAGPVLYENWLL